MKAHTTDTTPARNRSRVAYSPVLAGGLLALALLAGAVSARGEQLYKEAFYSFNSAPLNNVGWSVALGEGATAYSGGDATPGAYVHGPVLGPDGERGIGIARLPSATDYSLIVYTNEFAFTPSEHGNVRLSWAQGDSNTNISYRVVIKMGDDWYASAASYSMTAAATSIQTGAETKTFDFTEAPGTWLNLNFEAGAELSLGGVVMTALPDGEIISFGLFITKSAAGNMTGRFDDFTIATTPIPEPSSAALFLGLATMGWLMVRRRGSRNR